MRRTVAGACVLGLIAACGPRGETPSTDSTAVAAAPAPTAESGAVTPDTVTSAAAGSTALGSETASTERATPPANAAAATARTESGTNARSAERTPSGGDTAARAGSTTTASTTGAGGDMASDTTLSCPIPPLKEAVANAKSIAAAAKSDPLLVTDQEYGGWKTFHVYCYRCHGVDAMGGGVGPNLRHSVSSEGSVTPEVFVVTVLLGRLSKGMPAWDVLLDCENVTDLWAYINARSSGRLAPGRPHTAGSKG